MAIVRHIFLWRLADDSTQQEVLDLLNTLPEKLSVIKGWQIGSHAGDPGENGAPWNGALITDFDSWAALDEYSNDPYHLEVVAKLLPKFADRAVVDFEIGEQ